MVLGLTILGCHGHQFDPRFDAPSDTFEVDVAIIGGGATGSYATIALTDLNRNVIVVEATGVLGGQTNIYVDPSYNVSIDYGVERYGKDAGTLAFLDRLGVTDSAHTSSAANT